MTRSRCPNVSEGRDQAALDAIAAAFGPGLIHCSSDRDHHRAVFTLAGEPGELHQAVLDGARGGDRAHRPHAPRGLHPRVGVVDVAPIVYLDDERARRGLRRGARARRRARPARRPRLSLRRARGRADARRAATPGGLDALRARLRPAERIPRPARRSSPRGRRWSPSTSRSTRRSRPRRRSRRRCAPTLDVRALGLQLTERVQVSTNIEDHTRVTAAEVVAAVRAHATRHRRRARRARPARRARGLPAKTSRSAARNRSKIIYPRRRHGPDEAQEADQASRQCRGLDRGSRPHRPQAHRGGAEGGRPPDARGGGRRKPPTLEQRRAEGAARWP